VSYKGIEIDQIARFSGETTMPSRSDKHTLFGDVLRSVVNPLLKEFGSSDRRRIEQILQLSNSDRIRLSDCLAALFPDMGQPAALKALTNFRSRVNQTLEEHRSNLRLVVDSHKRNAPSER